MEESTQRQIVLDTETTGLDPRQGHRIIEIGCVEMIDRRLTGNNYHQYLQPDREIEQGAIDVHGITNEFLADKPRFVEIAESLMDYLRGAEVIIHNAPFDVGFIDAELSGIEVSETMQSLCEVTDTLTMARQMHPGQRNSLDALCGRYDIDNTHRTKHGALLDSEILAEVYLAMTGGQKSLVLEAEEQASQSSDTGGIRRLSKERTPLRVVRASPDELEAHQQRLEAIGKASGGEVVWLREVPSGDAAG